MNTRNIANNILFKEYDILKEDIENFFIKAFDNNMFSNIEFLNYFKNFKNKNFWVHTICLTSIPIEVIINTFKSNIFNKDVYFKLQNIQYMCLYDSYLHTEIIEYYVDDLAKKNILNNIEKYTNEYKKYIEQNKI